MDYYDALKYIGGRLRFGIKPGLDRIRGLLCQLGDPQDSLSFIHVAGTNGKGSVCTMTAAGLIEAGYKTALYTSPYICDFRERIQINGEMIPEKELARITERVKELIRDEEETTEFEVITCIALVWFAEQKCDLVVLETGLGGRLDATNVIPPPLSAVITRIDLDHTAVLGGSYALIAAEKAGIIKPGSRIVISPGQPREAFDELVRRCRECGAEPVIPDTGAVLTLGASLDGTDIIYKKDKYHIPLIGEHQVINALTAIEVLNGLGIDRSAIRGGIAQAFIPARMEVVCREPVIIIDGAHNPNGAQALDAAIKQLMPSQLESGGIIAVMGVLSDKDYRAELSVLAPDFSRIYCVDGFSTRSESADALAREAGKYTRSIPCQTPKAGLELALCYAKENDCAIIVCGSLYLAGELRAVCAANSPRGRKMSQNNSGKTT